MQVLSGVEVPQRLACSRIRGFEETLIIGEKYQAGCGRHDSAIAMSITGLRITPCKGPGPGIEGQKHLRALRIWITLGSGGVVLLTLGEGRRLAKIY